MTASTGDLHQLQGADGSRVRYRRWLPDGDVRGTVQLVHGASEHSGRYDRLATALTARGVGVWAMDLRGHGRTAESTGIGRFGRGGLGVDTVLGDVDALHLVIDDQHPNVPRVLLGHSMGSIIALASAERNGADLAGLVLSGPIGVAPHLADTVTALEEAVAAGAADHALDALGAFNEKFEPARTRYDWLSRDPDEVDAYISDPLSGDEMPLTVAYAAGCSPWPSRQPPRQRSRHCRTGCRCCCCQENGTRSAATMPCRSPRSPSCSPSAVCRSSSTSTPRRVMRSSTRPTATRWWAT